MAKNLTSFGGTQVTQGLWKAVVGATYPGTTAPDITLLVARAPATLVGRGAKPAKDTASS
ncbi:MAG: hypothetical protein LBS63_02630 [Prevotellaceae bacterium]|nr:hypothetical protein [Prevotellaceae bacterium]